MACQRGLMVRQRYRFLLFLTAEKFQFRANESP